MAELVAAGSAGPVRFSVVVPAYNEEHFLADTLHSLRSQDVAATIEVIVVDNNSSDATADLAGRLGATVVVEPRPGVCAARQAGSVVARGDIIVSTDADTVHPPDWLSRIDAAFCADPGAVAVAGPCRYPATDGWERRYPLVLFGLVHVVARRTGRVVYVSATNLAMTREAFPGYDVRQTQGGDELDLLRRLRRRGRVVWNHGNVVTTSPRRLQHGFAYGFFVSFLGNYVLTYLLNRLTGGRLLGTSRAYRPSSDAPAPDAPAPDAPGPDRQPAVVAPVAWPTEAAARSRLRARRR